MSIEQFANSAASTLNGAITSGATTLVVTSAATFPGTGNFRIIIDTEIMIVTAVSGTTYTVTRGAESTTAASHSNGAAVTHVITAGSLAQTISDAIASNTPLVGTLPTIVQSKGDTSGGQSITLTSAPVSGNLLVAMCFNPSVGASNTGWTNQASNSGGTDFGLIATKIAGAGESTTQSPLSGSPGGTGAIMMWEIHGQAASSYMVSAATQGEQFVNPATSPTIPNLSGVLTLGAVGLADSSNTITRVFNLIQDVLINTGNRRLFGGHASLLVSSLGQFVAQFSGGNTSKCGICSVTS